MEPTSLPGVTVSTADRIVRTLHTLLHLVTPSAFERLDTSTLDRVAREALARHETLVGAFTEAAERVGLHLAPEPMACERLEVFLRKGAVVLFIAEESAEERGELEIAWLDTFGRRKIVDDGGRPLHVDELHGQAFAVTPLHGLEPAWVEGEEPTPFRRLLHLLRLEGDDVRVMLVYAAIIGFLGLTTPVATQGLVNALAFGNILQPVLVLAVLVAGGLFFASVIQMARAWVAERLQRRVFARLALDLSWRLTSLPPDVRAKNDVGKLLFRFYDIVIVQKSLGLMLVDGIGLVMSAVVGLVLVFFYHPVFLAYAVVLGFLLVATVTIPFQPGVETAVKESKYKHLLAAWLHETAVHPITFGRLGADFARRRAESFTSEYLLHRARHWRVLFGQISVLLVIHVIAGSSLLAVGGWLVVREQITLGQLVASELVIMTVLASTAKLDKHIESLYDLLAALEKIGKLTDLRTTATETARSTGPVGLSVRSLHVLASPGRPVLAGITFNVECGSSLAILGAPGSGRTTLARVLAGDRPFSSGGFEYRQPDGHRVAPRVILLNTGMLFSGTLRENLHCWQPELHDERLEDALEAVGLSHLTTSLDMQVAREGGELYLSRAEESLVLFARALLTPSDVYIIDDLLDPLPRSMRKHVLARLDGQAHRPLVIATTTDPATAHLLDRVYTLPGGLA